VKVRSFNLKQPYSNERLLAFKLGIAQVPEAKGKAYRIFTYYIPTLETPSHTAVPAP
jgi:hypothetical protein